MGDSLETAHTRPGALVLTKKDKFTIWCSWHLDPDQNDEAEYTKLNQTQAAKLMKNYEEKEDEMLKKAFRSYLGRLPGYKETKKHLECRIFDDKADEKWFYFRKELLLFVTMPKSWLKESAAKDGGRYYLSWYAKDLTGAIKN